MRKLLSIKEKIEHEETPEGNTLCYITGEYNAYHISMFISMFASNEEKK